MKSPNSKDTIFPLKKAKSSLNKIISGFSKAKVLVVGDFILDEFVWGKVERISPEAPVPVVNVERESFMPGGALNVANNIRTLGARVYPCGVVGRDLHGRMLVKTMRREGIDTGGVIFDASRPTTLKTRVIAHSQQVVRFDREDSRPMTQSDLKRILEFITKTIPTIDVIIIEDYGKGVIVPELLTQVLRQAKTFKKPVLVDPKEKNFPYYRGVTVITPNRKEAYAAYGKREDGKVPDLYEVGKGLIKKFVCDAVLITLGEEGMMLFERSGEVTKIQTAAQEVYDVSGAGDTVIATVSLALAARASLKEAAVISNLAAGIVVGKLGTATVTQEELSASLALQINGGGKQACCHV
jgi:D-beta-D-heptose 7-phosphate kinase/D-beta-D-heptose 1-phosphate adenosyltransferase